MGIRIAGAQLNGTPELGYGAVHISFVKIAPAEVNVGISIFRFNVDRKFMMFYGVVDKPAFVTGNSHIIMRPCLARRFFDTIRP